MSDLCQRWKHLLTDLVLHPDAPELDQLPRVEAEMLRAHMIECEDCENTDLREFLGNTPSNEAAMKLLMKLSAFMEGKAPDTEDDITGELNKAVDVERQSLEVTCAGFVARHPELDFEKFALPSARLSPLVAFRTADATAMLLRRYHRRGETPFSFRMTPDGACEPIGQTSIISASTIVNEIGRWLWDAPWEIYRPTKSEMTPQERWDEYEGFRRLNRDEDGKDVIVPRLISWLFAALKVSPELMYGYRARLSDNGAEWILEPFAKGERINNEDKDKPWRV